MIAKTLVSFTLRFSNGSMKKFATALQPKIVSVKPNQHKRSTTMAAVGIKLMCVKCVSKRIRRVPLICDEGTEPQLVPTCTECIRYYHYRQPPTEYVSVDEYLARTGGLSGQGLNKQRERKTTQRNGYSNPNDLEHYMTPDGLDEHAMPSELRRRLRLEKQGGLTSAAGGGAAEVAAAATQLRDKLVTNDILDQLYQDLHAGADHKQILAKVVGAGGKRKRTATAAIGPLEQAKIDKQRRLQRRIDGAGATSAAQRRDQPECKPQPLVSGGLQRGERVMVDMHDGDLHPGVVTEPYVDDVDDDASSDAPEEVGKHEVCVFGYGKKPAQVLVVRGVYRIDAETCELTLV